MYDTSRGDFEIFAKCQGGSWINRKFHVLVFEPIWILASVYLIPSWISTFGNLVIPCMYLWIFPLYFLGLKQERRAKRFLKLFASLYRRASKLDALCAICSPLYSVFGLIPSWKSIHGKMYYVFLYGRFPLWDLRRKAVWGSIDWSLHWKCSFFFLGTIVLYVYLMWKNINYCLV